MKVTLAVTLKQCQFNITMVERHNGIIFFKEQRGLCGGFLFMSLPFLVRIRFLLGRWAQHCEVPMWQFTYKNSFSHYTCTLELWALTQSQRAGECVGKCFQLKFAKTSNIQLTANMHMHSVLEWEEITSELSGGSKVANHFLATGNLMSPYRISSEYKLRICLGKKKKRWKLAV